MRTRTYIGQHHVELGYCVLGFELKEGRIVRKFVKDTRTNNVWDLPMDWPIPGWEAYGG